MNGSKKMQDFENNLNHDFASAALIKSLENASQVSLRKTSN